MKSKYTQVSLTYTRGEQFPMGNGSTQHTTLGLPFIESCLERPDKPGKSATSLEYEIWSNWHKLTLESKISNGIKRYVKDLGGSKPEFKFI